MRFSEKSNDIGVLELKEEIEKLRNEIAGLRSHHKTAYEEKYTAAFRSNPNALVLSHKISGKILEVNDGFLSLIDRAKDEVINNTTIALNLYAEPEDRERMLVLMRKQGFIRNFETIINRKSGEKRTVLISAEVLIIEGEKQILSNIQDITDLKKIEDDLKKSREHLAVEHSILNAVIENIGVGFVVSDSVGNVISMNKAASEIHGFKDENEGLIHLHDYENNFQLQAIDGRILSNEEWPLALALNGQFFKGYKFRMINFRQKTHKIVSYNAVPIYDHSGLPVYIILTITDHTEEERRAAIIKHERELFEGIFDNIPVMINIFDPELKSHQFNNAFKKVLGWSEKEAMSGNFMEMVYPDPVYRNEVSAYMKTLKTGWKELRLRARDGSFIESDWANIRLSDGIMIGIGIDTRERKVTEEKIRVNEQRLQAIFDKAAIGIVETNEQDRYVSVNDRICQILGYTREELLGKSVTEITYPDDVKQTAQLNASLHKGELPLFHYEKRYNKKDGNPIWVHVSVTAVLDAQGKYMKSIGTVEDISERKQYEQNLLKALREAEEGRNILIALMKYIPLGITIAEAPEIKISMISQYGLDMFHTNMEEMTSTPFNDRSVKMGFLHLDGKTPGKAEEMPLARAIANGEIITNEEWLIKKADGSFLSINCHAAPILDRNGSVIGGVIAWQDMTELKNNEKEIRQKNEELTRFIYTVSHDLKSPLVTIKSFTEYLKEDILTNDVEAQEKDMGYIRNAADKMGDLLDELLELSRIGRKENPKTEIPLKEIVQAALDLVAGSISKNRVSIKLDCAQVVVFGYSQRLVQLYQNLIDNAVKFMGSQPSPEIEIGTKVDEHQEIIFYVKDNGSGIDPRYHHKIFGLFEKLDNSTQGTGIGLALVKRIVELHGGKIWFESAGKGMGTAFFFTLSKSYRIQ